MVSKFWHIRVIEGQFVPRELKLVRVIGVSRNEGRVREIGGEIIELVKQIRGKQGLVRDFGRFGKPRVQEMGIPV